jgi:N-acetylmuramoyl-L-alanine amidase
MKALKVLVGMAAITALTAGAAFAQPKICIDPGHGGTDPGAVGGGQTEAANVLDTGNRFKAWLDLDTTDTAGGHSWTVLRTRSTDTTVSLSGRTTYANDNGAARFMSIHNNAATSTAATGIETFCAPSLGTSGDLRNKVQEEAVGVWPLTNRGNKTANYYVLVYTSMPAELHEMGFITNSGDRDYLGSATQRDLHAKSELWAIQRHYGYAKYTPSAASTVIIADNGTSAWSASSNWIASTSVPGYYGSNYHYRNTQAVSDAAVWTVNVPTAGTYRVDARWTAGSNRAPSAPYIIAHSGGNTTVNVNQQLNNNTWVSLGNYSFAAGNRTVSLSCWTTTGYVVIGDAVRFTRL